MNLHEALPFPPEPTRWERLLQTPLLDEEEQLYYNIQHDFGKFLNA